ETGPLACLVHDKDMGPAMLPTPDGSAASWRPLSHYRSSTGRGVFARDTHSKIFVHDLRSASRARTNASKMPDAETSLRATYAMNRHCDAGVRVSMLRPRLRWSSTSAAHPSMRGYKNIVKAAVSSADGG